MGVPVIVLSGEAHFSRVGVILMSNIGASELIADSIEEYVGKTIKLASNLNRLISFRFDLRSMMIEKWLLLAFVVLFFAFAFFSSELRIRYVVPIIPPLAVLSVYGMKNMFEVVTRYNSENAKRVWRIIIFGLAACSLWPNAAYVIRQFGEVRPFVFQSGAITRDEYIAK